MCIQADAAPKQAGYLVHLERKLELLTSEHVHGEAHVRAHLLLDFPLGISEHCTVLVHELSKVLVSLHYVFIEIVAAQVNLE